LITLKKFRGKCLKSLKHKTFILIFKYERNLRATKNFDIPISMQKLELYLLKEFGLSSLGLRMTLIELQKINNPTPAGLSIIIANESKNK